MPQSFIHLLIRPLTRATRHSFSHGQHSRHRPFHLPSPSNPISPPSSPIMHTYIELIGSGTPDTSSSFQLFFDEARYLFECGDGTQRTCTEYSVRNMKLRQIFLTSLSAPSIGGLLGLSLTLADSSKTSLAVAAPAGISTFFAKAQQSFYYRPDLDLKLLDIDLETRQCDLPILITKDENVCVSAVPVKSKRDVQIDTAFGAHYDAVAYICQLNDMVGKFNPTRAIELGVKKGPNFGLLVKGGSVTTENGTVVIPQQVMSPSTPGPVVLVVPCPTLEHVDSVVRARALHPDELGVLKKDGAELDRNCVVVHMAPKCVLDHPEYIQWCDSFGADVSHIPIHSSVRPRRTVFASQAEALALLHDTVDKNFFPVPEDTFIAGEGNGTERDEGELFSDRVGKWLQSDGRLRYQLSPAANVGPDMSFVRPNFIERKTSLPVKHWKELVPIEEQEPAGNGMKTPACIAALPPGTVAVRFFGTGAAIPSKRRNVSSLMIDMFELGGVLLDCGEGTWGQMVRHFGLDRAKRKLCELKVIFISHMHADHHLGLLNLLHERTAALNEMEEYRKCPQLHIIGPYYLNQWLEEFQRLARVPLQQQSPLSQRSFRFFSASKLTDPQAPEAKHFPNSFGIEVGCVEVEHCKFSYGISIRHQTQQWKVVYSGDTRPCEALAEMGRGATLAIHEATLEDEMKEEALLKMHSTTSEALEICGKMGAWRTILTHFSQRYAKVPKMDEKVMNQLKEARACIAFDLMCVDFSRLEELPWMVPAVRDCFPDDIPPDDVVESTVLKSEASEMYSE